MGQRDGNVILAGARTPMGRLLGSLAEVPATELAGVAIRAAVQRSGLRPDQVDGAVLGQVLSAGTGQAPFRQAAVAGGLPLTVPSIGVNKVCLSGLEAIITADLMVRSGLAEVVVAGGMESMSRAPHLMPASRRGVKYGSTTLIDHLAYDGLHDALTDQSMGLLTEQANVAADFVTREEQDAVAALSHRRAAQAWAQGRFADEVVAVEVAGRGGGHVVDADEGIRPDTSTESLARLRPAFAATGTVTAGNASQISDGACAVVVTSRARAERLNLPWIGEIVAAGQVAGPDTTLQRQPSAAIRAACTRAGLSPAQLDLLEINEAFAAIVVASARDLDVPLERVNVNGGAIALGHPIGMSGARLVLTLALELGRRGGGFGAAGLCGGGGQGSALIVKVP